MPRDRRPYILLPIAAFIAVLPLIVRGCSCGHDFDFHIVSWFEAARQFAHGTIHPHWAFTPAWNAGEPRFVFYPPLSWAIGGTLGLIMPWAWTPIVYVWMCLTAAGLALNYAARSFTTPNAALIAAAIYIANPYTLYTAYERSAYAELLAAAWIPLLLDAILRQHVTIPRIAVPVALLWLTNAPAAVMGCYALALLATVRLVLSFSESGAPFMRLRRMGGTSRESAPAASDNTSREAGRNRLDLTVKTAAGTALGLGLAAFYILPAAYERRFVQIAFAVLPSLRPQGNFLFHHTADPQHDAVLRTASVVAVIIIALTAATLTFIYFSDRRTTTESGAPFMRLHRMSGTSRESTTAPVHLSFCLAILTLAIVFMLTPLSAFFWIHLPEMRFLQFPWRLVAILAAIFALLLAVALSRLTLKPSHAAACVLIAAALFAVPANLRFQQRCYPEDTLPARLAVFHLSNPGTDPTDEYTPITADNDALGDANPGYWLSLDAGSSPPRGAVPGPAPRQLDLISAAPQTLILNLRDYPAWRITLNGSPAGTRLRRDDGLIAIPLPSGASHVDIAYIAPADQNFGYLISALSLFCFTALLVRNGLKEQE
ncbi:MAG: hypothetical protein JST61_00380 [Acidobacteria bacterium]|nr:hypothetical protein [Acidobacteriota bacterium]